MTYYAVTLENELKAFLPVSRFSIIEIDKDGEIISQKPNIEKAKKVFKHIDFTKAKLVEISEEDHAKHNSDSEDEMYFEKGVKKFRKKPKVEIREIEPASKDELLDQKAGQVFDLVTGREIRLGTGNSYPSITKAINETLNKNADLTALEIARLVNKSLSK